jgi:ATP-binding cassette, subfamily D (ALD), peroxisomal long-chain fatty acid import protein
MATLSTLKPTKEQISRLTSTYSRNRPIIQRFLLVGFVVHVLRSTVTNFASGRSASSRKGKTVEKGNVGDSGKPPRVAVSI